MDGGFVGIIIVVLFIFFLWKRVAKNNWNFFYGPANESYLERLGYKPETEIFAVMMKELGE